MSKTIPSATLRSPSDAIAARAIFKPEKRRDWTSDRQVPQSVLIERERAQRKQDMREYRMNHERSRVKRLGVFATTTENGFRIVGFGRTVATEGEVRQVAVEAGRQFYKIDDNSEVSL